MIKNDTSLNASHTRIYEGPNEESISFIDDKTAGKSPETFSEDQIEKNCSSTMEKKQISGFSESEQKPNFRNQYLATLVGKYSYGVSVLIHIIVSSQIDKLFTLS